MRPLPTHGSAPLGPSADSRPTATWIVRILGRCKKPHTARSILVSIQPVEGKEWVVTHFEVTRASRPWAGRAKMAVPLHNESLPSSGPAIFPGQQAVGWELS